MPDAQSTFGAALSNLIGKSKGKSGVGAIGDPVKELNAEQQQKVLKWIQGELEGRRAALESDREGSEAAKKLENLKRKIFVRDRLENDPIMRGRRIFERDVDGNARGFTGAKTSLGEIIDQEIAKDTPSLKDKYAAKYKKAILDTIRTSPAKMGETAGALSAGDYSTVMDQAADWGAAGFGTMVSDALLEMGHESTKVIWDKAVTKAGTAKDVLIALNKGNPDAAWAAIVKDYKAEVKAQARNVAKSTINWVFDAGNGTASLGDFIPESKTIRGSRLGSYLPDSSTIRNTISKDLFGLTPGDIYLKILDAEVAFIGWAQKQLRKASDGVCIQRYIDAHKSSGGNINSAYEKFNECISMPDTSRYSALWEFGNQARSAGMDNDAALKAFLEAHRRGMPNSHTPLDWIKAQVEKQKKKMEKIILPELTRTEKVMANIATRVGSAMDNRITDLAAAALNEKQWDKLEGEIKELEDALEKTLDHVRADLNRIERYSWVLGEACNDYDKNKAIARSALKEALTLSTDSSRIWGSLLDIDPASCKVQPTQTTIGTTPEQLSALEADLASLEGMANGICQLPESIKTAADNGTAKTLLEQGMDTAIQARGLADKIRSAIASSQQQKPDTSNSDTSVRDKVISQLDSLANDTDSLDGRFSALRGKYDPAYNAMAEARRKVENLETGTSPIIERVRSCLRPLAEAPVAREPRKILEDLIKKDTNNVGCRETILESWHERDADPLDGPGMISSTPWRLRQLSLSHSVPRLREKIAELQGQCQVGPDGQPVTTAQGDNRSQLEGINTQAGSHIAQIDQCLASAEGSFRDNWELAGLSPEMIELLGRAQQALASCDVDFAREISKQLQGQKHEKLRAAASALDSMIASAEAIANAENSFVSGNLEAAEASLNTAGKSPCVKHQARIAELREQITNIRNTLRQANAALAACNINTAQELINKIRGTNHILLDSTQAALERMLSAHRKNNASKQPYLNGDLDLATNYLTSAQSDLNRIGQNRCPDLRERINTRLQTISKLRTALARADAAIKACKRPTIEAMLNQFSKHSHILTKRKSAQLKVALNDCAEKERQNPTTIAQARQLCIDKYGTGATARRNDKGKFTCHCGKGYTKNSSGNGCISKTELAADGRHYCANKIEGGVLKRVVKPGQYKCGCPAKRHYDKYRNRCITWNQVVAEGRRVCKHEGKILGHVNKFDNYICCPSGMPYYKKSNNTCYAQNPNTRRAQRPQQPRTNPNDAAAVIQGLSDLINRSRGREDHPHPPSRSTRSTNSSICRNLIQALQKSSNRTRYLTRIYKGQKNVACEFVRLAKEQQVILLKMKTNRCPGANSIPLTRIPSNASCR